MLKYKQNMEVLPMIFLFVLGLIMGSFLNCLTWRVKNNRSILEKHSICPNCQRELGFWGLIPLLSFIFQRGRCRYCQKKISWQYPLAELSAGILFALSFLKFGWSLNLFFNLIFISFLVLIFIFDLKYYLIPDVFTLPAVIVAFLVNAFLGHNIFNLILAGVVGGGIFLFQFLVSRGRWVGAGDIRLGLMMGIMLSWPVILVALVLAYFSGAIVGILLILTKRKTLKSELPFGAFLAPATVFCLFFGQAILNWYLSLVWF